MRRIVPPFPPSGPGASQHQFPAIIGTTGSYVSSSFIMLPLRSPLIGTSRYHFRGSRNEEVFPKFLGYPFVRMLRACDSGGSYVTRLTCHVMLSSILCTMSTSATIIDFGADSLAACALAVYASHLPGHPDKWQDSLPVCSLQL